MAALDEAIVSLRAAAAAVPADHAFLPGVLGNLSGALTVKFERTGDPTVLEEAVDVGRRAATMRADRGA
jgi:hypothetical protein